MSKSLRLIAFAAVPLLLAAANSIAAGKTMADVLVASKSSDWRPLDPQNTLYLDLPKGRVVIELAPQFAPNHVANIRALARSKYFDGLAIVRSQENYVVQWGDPDAKKPFGEAKKSLAPEFTHPGARPEVHDAA